MKQRTLRGVFMTALAVILTLATGGAVMAFNAGPSLDGPIIPASDGGGAQGGDFNALATTCMTPYTNGSGADLLEWCYSEDGNIVSIVHSDGLEHVANGSIIEGWCVSAGHVKLGETQAFGANITLEPPTYPHPTKVRHHTSDGSLRVESRFSTSPGNKQIIVKMNVRNLTNAPINDVFLTRFIDADMSNTTGGDVWSSTGRSVTVNEPGSASMQLFPKTDEFFANSMIFSGFSPNLDEDCYDATADSNIDDLGDRSMGVMYQLGTIFPGDTKTVQFIYRISA